MLPHRNVNRLVGTVRRFMSTASVPRDEPKFTHTINLPKTKFPARLNADKRADVQDRLRKVGHSIGTCAPVGVK